MGLEEAEMKRQAMMQAQKEKQQAAGGKGGGAKMQGGANVQDARREMTKTKEQLEEEKISLSIRIKPPMLMLWTPTNSPAKPRSFGIPLSGSRPRNTILKKDRRDRTTTLKNSRRDRNNN